MVGLNRIPFAETKQSFNNFQPLILLTLFCVAKISQFSPVPIKPSRQQIADRNALMDLDLGRTPNDIGDASVSQ